MRSSLVLAGIALALIAALSCAFMAYAAGEEPMNLHKRQEIEDQCERLVYTFLRLFESEHAKTADLFTEDGSAEFIPGSATVGREAIREAFSAIDPNKVEVNVLFAGNLVITVVDENAATGVCYVTHYQHAYKDSKRQGPAILRSPNTITKWFWEFKPVDGEWKISKLDVKVTLLNERFVAPPKSE
jgi:hypothetical protein